MQTQRGRQCFTYHAMCSLTLRCSKPAALGAHAHGTSTGAAGPLRGSLVRPLGREVQRW
jgi:hypothetical protein